MRVQWCKERLTPKSKPAMLIPAYFTFPAPLLGVEQLEEVVGVVLVLVSRVVLGVGVGVGVWLGV